MASGPPLFTLNLRLSKTFGLGPKLEKGASSGPTGGGPGGGGGRGGGGGGLGGRGLAGGGGSPFTFGNETSHKYNLTFSVSARNLLNNVNYAPPIGILGSHSVRYLERAGPCAVFVRLRQSTYRSTDAVFVLAMLAGAGSRRSHQASHFLSSINRTTMRSIVSSAFLVVTLLLLVITENAIWSPD